MSQSDTKSAAGQGPSLTKSGAQSSAQSEDRSELVRGLGLWAATAIVISDTIGSGIFLVSSDMARAVSSARLVCGAWIIGGLIALCGAFCYAELRGAFLCAGCAFVYLAWSLGPSG